MQTSKLQPGTISVLIPSFGHAAYIRQTLDSVLQQTRPPHEVIVINDGSPDDTASAVHPYLGRILYIEQENQGLVATLNRGLSLSSGDYVLAIASDDWLRPDALELLGDVLDSHPDIGLVYGGMTLVDDAGNIYPDRQANMRAATFPGGKHRNIGRLIMVNYIPAPATLCRRKALEDAGPYLNYTFCQDWAMWLLIALKGWHLYGIEQSIAFYRRHRSNLSAPQNKLKAARDEFNMINDFAKQFGPQVSRAERQAFQVSRRQLLRGFAWASLLNGERGVAIHAFTGMLFIKPGLDAVRGLVFALLPISFYYRARKIRVMLRDRQQGVQSDPQY